MEYHSFLGGFTIEEAVEHLGADHVYMIISHENYHAEISRRVNGAWHANLGRDHRAYCAIMQAGQWVVRNIVLSV